MANAIDTQVKSFEILTGEQVFDVTFIDGGLPYKDGTKKAEKGLTYSRYRFNGTVFTVDDDSAFIADFKSGNVKRIKLENASYDRASTDADGKPITETVSSLRFDTYLNKAQWRAIKDGQIEDAEDDYKISKFKKLAAAPLQMSDELHAAFATQG
jgi:hypothetical protein